MKILTGIIVTLLIVFGGLVCFNINPFEAPTEAPSIGITSVGSSYAWTSTSTGSATQQLIEDNPVVLGSVIITTDSAGTFVVNNATSTTDADAETVASFEATQGEGTYTFDTYLNRGLQIISGASGDGLITVTYRQQ